MKIKDLLKRFQHRSSGSAVVQLATEDRWKTLIADGYTPVDRLPQVQMCVHAYTDLIGAMTLHLMENASNGDRRIHNELSRKLDINPNHLMTRQQFISAIVETLILTGNAVVYPEYSADGYLRDLHIFEPENTSFIEYPGGYQIGYKGRVYNPDEVLHFVWRPDPNHPWRGQGMMVSLNEIVQNIRQANATRKALLESPAPSIIVKVDGLTEDFASKEGRRQLASQYLDASENGMPWFIPAEAFAVEQVKPLTMQDLAIEQSLTLDKRAIAAALGVPPFMVGVGEYNKDVYNGFVMSKVMIVAKVIEQEMTKKLLVSPKLYLQFNPRSMYTYSMNELVSAGVQLVDRNALRRNELRDWIGMPPDPDMDDLLALENYIPADRLGDQKKLNPDTEGGETDGTETNDIP